MSCHVMSWRITLVSTNLVTYMCLCLGKWSLRWKCICSNYNGWKQIHTLLVSGTCRSAENSLLIIVVIIIIITSKPAVTPSSRRHSYCSTTLTNWPNRWLDMLWNDTSPQAQWRRHDHIIWPKEHILHILLISTLSTYVLISTYIRTYVSFTYHPVFRKTHILMYVQSVPINILVSVYMYII